MFGPTARLAEQDEETEDEETQQDDDSETGPVGPGPFDGPGFGPC